MRRFKNPLADAIERVRELRARRGVEVKVSPVEGATTGLSRSLQEGEGRRKNLERQRAGSRDDLNLGKSQQQQQQLLQGVDVDQMLDRMWRREVGAVSHE